MPMLNYTTTVTAERTAGEVQSIRRPAGAGTRGGTVNVPHQHAGAAVTTAAPAPNPAAGPPTGAGPTPAAAPGAAAGVPSVPPTDAERRVLLAIAHFVDGRGYPPTVAELCRAVGAKSTSSVHRLLTGLEWKGYIRRVPGSPRAIQVLVRP